MSEIKAITAGTETVPTVDKQLRDSLNLSDKIARVDTLTTKISGDES